MSLKPSEPGFMPGERKHGSRTTAQPSPPGLPGRARSSRGACAAPPGPRAPRSRAGTVATPQAACRSFGLVRQIADRKRPGAAFRPWVRPAAWGGPAAKSLALAVCQQPVGPRPRPVSTDLRHRHSTRHDLQRCAQASTRHGRLRWRTGPETEGRKTVNGGQRTDAGGRVWRMGDGERGTGNREQGTGNREQGSTVRRKAACNTLARRARGRVCRGTMGPAGSSG